LATVDHHGPAVVESHDAVVVVQLVLGYDRAPALDAYLQPRPRGVSGNEQTGASVDASDPKTVRAEVISACGVG